jgi:PQQ-like domain
MNQKTLLCAVLFLAVSQLFAQRKADWTADLPAGGNEIFFHSLTGVPIVKGDDYYAGINVQTHAVSWTIKRSSMQAVAAVLGSDEGEDYFEVANSPYAVVNQTLVDTRDGKIVLQREKDAYKKIADYELIPSLDAILVRTSAEGVVRLHLIDKKTGTKKWSSDVLKSSNSLGSLMGSAKGQVPQTMVATGTSTTLQNNQFMVFQYKKEIAMINVADGKVMWTEKLDPARTFFSKDQKTAFFVEHDKGGLIAQALSTGIKRMGKEITAITVADGKQVWKKPIEADEQIKWYDLQDDKLLIVHAKGCNFYTVADGKKVWKDDYDAKKIAKLEENAEGYLVSFGFRKTMQLDKSGKKIWKKAKVSEADEDTDVDEDADYTAFNYDNGTLFLYAAKLAFSPKKGGAVKKFSMSITPESKLGYDKERKTVLLFDKDGVHLINPDKFPKGFVEKDTKTKVEDIQLVEMRKDGYYFSGNEDFVIASSEGVVIERHYKEPFDGKSFLSSAVNTALVVGSIASAVSAHTNVMTGSTEALGGALTGNDEMKDGGIDKANKGIDQKIASNMMADAASFMPPTRHSAFSQTRDFSYYFTKDKATKEKVLIKVSKDTGEEVDKLVLNDARPVYKVDDVENRVLYLDKKQLLVFEAKASK